MNATQPLIHRPRRWQEPFDHSMNSNMVSEVLEIEPFASMDAERFPKNTPLAGIVQNDCRIVDLKKGDIVVREGDYGNSAFLILSGEALVSLRRLSPEILGREQRKQKTFLSSIAQLWSNDKFPEVRRYGKRENNQLGQREDRHGTHVFLHDIPRVISPEKSESMFVGEFFGEQSALTRTPRSATVVANQDTRLLEIRWQGLRDLMKSDPALKSHIETLYRSHSLQAHLREVDLFSNLAQQQLDVVAANTKFESFGKFQWNIDYRSTRSKDISARILDEPLIVDQGEYVNALYLIRTGFVRICRKHGKGIQTVAYMGKGGVFGLREIANNWRSGEQKPWGLSLRAVGYVDVLRIPVETIESSVLPFLNISGLSGPPMNPVDTDSDSDQPVDQRRGNRKKEMDRGLLEFLVEERFTNGSKALMIDLNRCTRCDDCVRACASTHNNNPRFVRQGPVHDNWMFANACMHCIDPVCMIGCPTGAIGRDHQSGNVTINDTACIGCATCSNSCPYNNIRMVEINDSKGQKILDKESNEPIVKATKCDFCIDQLGGPACQRACPHDALIRINLTEPDEVTQWTG